MLDLLNRIETNEKNNFNRINFFYFHNRDLALEKAIPFLK